MKKLFSLLLALVMLAGLSVPALAADEPVIAEETAAEEDIVIVEDEPVVEEPAADGAVVGVSGTLNAYQFSDNAELELKGDTTLIINADKTLPRIFGDHALTITIDSGKTLRINNTNGHGIDVSSLTVNGAGALVVTGAKNGLNVKNDINVTGVSIDITAGTDGVYSQDGNISLNGRAVVKSTGGNAIFAPWGSVTLSGEVTASTFKDNSACVRSGDTRKSTIHIGRIFFRDGTFDLTADSVAVYSLFGDIEISGNLKAVSNTGTAILSNKLTGINPELKGTITIDNAQIEARGKDRGIHCAGNIVIMDGNIVASGGNYGIYAEDGITMSSKLSVITPSGGKIKGSTVYAGDAVAKNVVIAEPLLTRVDFTTLTTTLKSGDPEKPKAVLASGSRCTAYAGFWLEHVSGGYYDGTAGQGKTYYYSLEITPNEGYTFGGVGTVVPVYLNGKKVGDATVLEYTNVIKLRMRVEYTVPVTGLAVSKENFPDGWFRDYILEYIDTEEDGYLTDAERNAVTEIDIDNCDNQSYYWSVTSLEGIKYFPNLQYLTCGSGLKTLDLSKNTKLIEVRLNDNDAGGDLTSLNVRGCTALEYLSFFDNQVSSLDLTTNTKLTYLCVDGNPITSLDLSKNTNLEQLDVGGCKKLTSLDLSANTKLRSLRMNNSGVSAVDLSGLSALETLYCENCGMTSLNVTKNPGLTWLNCGSNRLKALDVSKNPKLRTLDCRDNQLSALNLSSCPALSCLYCYGNTLTTLDIGACPNLQKAYDGKRSESKTTLHGKEFKYLYCTAAGGLLLAVDTDVKVTADGTGTAKPAVTLSADAKTAQATNFDGLYARVALVLDNNGVSGLYVTQASINTDGTVVMPSFMVPGLTVKGINIALVPTLADISSPQPNVKASDFRML